MIEDIDLHDANSVTNESVMRHGLKKSELAEKSENCTKVQEDKFSGINNRADNDTDDMFNKSLEGEDSNVGAEHKNEIDHCSNSDSEKFYSKTLNENDAQSEQRTEKPDKNIHNRLSKILDSDSEDDNMFTFNSKNKVPVLNKSEDEESDSERTLDCSKDKSGKGYKSRTKIFLDSDSDDASNIATDNDAEGTVSKEKKAKHNTSIDKFRSLIDSESDEEENRYDEEQSSPGTHKKSTKHKEKSKSKTVNVSLRASKEEAKKQIQSETQRLIRESEVSLPYHNPKQRTLQEFLNRRKVITALPKAPTMAAKLKMSSAIVDKVLKEKEKEAEAFYKSSDSEEEVGEINNECTRAESSEACKKDKASKRLFVGNDWPIPEISTPKGNTNTMEDIHDSLTETKEIVNDETMINGEAEKNTNDSAITEDYCEPDATENGNENSNGITETIENNDLNGPLKKGDTAQAITGENISNDTDKQHTEILDELPDVSKPTNDYAKMVRRSLGMTAEEGDEYNEYGLPPPIFGDSPNINEKKVLLNRNLKPKLQGSAGMMIDLTDDTKSAKTGLSNLMDRFVFNHSKVTGRVKDNTELTVTHVKESPSGLSIIKETLPYRIPIFGDSPNINEKKVLLNRNLKSKLQGSPGMMIDLTDDTKSAKTGLGNLMDRFVFNHSKVTGRVKDNTELTVTHVKESPSGLSIIKETLPYRIPIFGDSPNINEKKVLLNRNLKPKLQGSPGMMIDLTDDTKSAKTGLSNLMDRFVFNHSKVTGRVKDNTELTMTHVKESPSGFSIIKETLPYRIPSVVDEDPKLKKPGAKLQRLKEELKHKMALKREEEWKQREQELKEQEIEWNDSINEDDHLGEPFSPNIEFHRSEDDELEEEVDVYKRREKKKKKRSAFIDDEAEVSEDDNNESDEIEDDDEDERQDRSDEGEEECERLVLEDENSTGDGTDLPKCNRTLNRIVEPVEDDSRSSEVENIGNTVNKGKDEGTTFSQFRKIFDSRSRGNEELLENESDISISQACIKNVPNYETSQTSQSKNNTFDFVSPATQLTALNTDLEEQKDSMRVEKSSFIDPILIGSTQSQLLSQELKDSKNQDNFCKKLFTVQGNVLDEELMEIASGQFSDDKVNNHFSKEPDVSESQLLELCSGTFNSQRNSKESTDFSDDVLPQVSSVSRERDALITKKDEQQLDHHATWKKLRVVSSDEEDLLQEETKKRRMKKRVQKLDVSDDEEENESVVSSDEDENENENENEDEEKYVDYDSEENEVVVSRKDMKKYATKFLDEEAELSESDCDVSADEDEKDLDNLELEDGDDEEIDEAQVRSQVGKLHMKQLLDEDQKEVRMLQEMLFEDGDLYSESGRERKFKWKNIDNQVDDKQVDSQSLEGKDGWVDLSDDEDEAKWRKLRHEREKFLAEKTTNDDSEIENDLNESQIFKFGLKILKKKRLDESQKQNTLVETLDTNLEPRRPHTIADMLNTSKCNDKSRSIHSVMQKRSFLARGEEKLARLAVLARRKEAPLPSKAKNFVFAHIDLDTGNESGVSTEATSKRHRSTLK